MAFTAFIFADGLDDFGTGGYPANSVFNVKWTTTNNVGIYPGRIDGYSVLLDSNSSTIGQTFANKTTFAVCFAFNIVTALGALVAICNLKDAGTVQVGIGFDAAQRLIVFRSSTGTILATSVESYNLSTWYQVECKFTISDFLGVVELRVNGNPTPVISITAADTKATANAYCNQIEFTSGPSNLDVAIDDVIIREHDGLTVTSDWIGNAHIQTLSPTANGPTVQWAPSAGANYQCVDENPANTTDYVSSSTVGHIDLYDFPAIVGTLSTIYAVQQNTLATLDAAGVNTFSNVFNNGFEYLSAALAPTAGSYLDMQTLWMQNPSTLAAWTQANINAGYFGEKVLT